MLSLLRIESSCIKQNQPLLKSLDNQHSNNCNQHSKLKNNILVMDCNDKYQPPMPVFQSLSLLFESRHLWDTDELLDKKV